MTAPVDLTAVKAMLVDALRDADTMKRGWIALTPKGDRIATAFDRYADHLYDADKLAATVVEWFAKNGGAG
jgi:hypothetical protein